MNTEEKRISDNILKSYGVDIEKAGGHKYYKREGVPGKYKYYYSENEYNEAKGKQDIDRIDTKVKGQMEMLTEHSKKMDEVFTKKLASERAKERNKGGVEQWEKKQAESQLLHKTAREMMNITTSWNKEKAVLDRLYNECEKTGDPRKLGAQLDKMYKTKPKEMLENATKVKRARVWLKLDTPLRNDLLNQAKFMRDAYVKVGDYVGRKMLIFKKKNPLA